MAKAAESWHYDLETMRSIRHMHVAFAVEGDEERAQELGYHGSIFFIYIN
jgi:hypothetical protein